jgi:exosortase K
VKAIKVNHKLCAQLVAVLLIAWVTKSYYSTASVNQLRWILAPTTFAVELLNGSRFEFESYAGYLSSDRSFVIAASCAGVNFLITAFLLLALRRIWKNGSTSWTFIPIAAAAAYMATVLANTVRISTALQLRQMPLEMGGLSREQLHRVEGIVVYFGFLLLLFVISERFSDRALHEKSTLWRQCLFPLLLYYATTLAIPLANGIYRSTGAVKGFWEHSLFVLLTPLVFVIPLAVFCLYRDRQCSPAVETGIARSLKFDSLTGGG